MRDLVTISIPTYRRPSLLLHALHSCFAQDYRPLEVDVSDNSPTDDTGALLAGVRPPEGITLRYWRNAQDLGCAGNVNKLFAEARGRRLVLLPDDDVLLPGAVSALNAGFALAPDVVLVYGTQQFIGGNGEMLPAEESAAFNAGQRRTAAHAGVHRDLLVRALWRQIPGAGHLIDAALARRVCWRSGIGAGADFDFDIRLAQACRSSASFVLLDQPVSQFRIWPDRLTQSADDVHTQVYDLVAALEGLTPAEELARDECLAEFAWKAMTDNARFGRRLAALRIFFSRHYARARNPLRSAYALGLVALPGMTETLRRVATGTR